MGLLATVLLLLQMPGAEGNHSAGFHWRQSSKKLTVQLINSTQDSLWADGVSTRVKKWSEGSDELNINISAGSTDASTRYSCPKLDGKVRVCNYSYGKTGSNNFAGLTTWYPRTGHLQWVTIKLNDSITTPAYRRAVICHELGHALGLAHQSQSNEGTKTTPGTCMTPAVHTYQTLPKAHDFEELERIYGHAHKNGSSGAVATVDKAIGVHFFNPDKLLP